MIRSISARRAFPILVIACIAPLSSCTSILCAGPFTYESVTQAPVIADELDSSSVWASFKAVLAPSQFVLNDFSTFLMGSLTTTGSSTSGIFQAGGALSLSGWGGLTKLGETFFDYTPSTRYPLFFYGASAQLDGNLGVLLPRFGRNAEETPMGLLKLGAKTWVSYERGDYPAFRAETAAFDGNIDMSPGDWSGSALLYLDYTSFVSGDLSLTYGGGFGFGVPDIYKFAHDFDYRIPFIRGYATFRQGDGFLSLGYQTMPLLNYGFSVEYGIKL